MPGRVTMTVADARAQGLLPPPKKRAPRPPPSTTQRYYAVCGPGRRCAECAAWLAQQGIALPRWMHQPPETDDDNPFHAV